MDLKPQDPSLGPHIVDLDLNLDMEDIKYHFDESSANKPGPSSAGLEDQRFFDDLPVLEKGGTVISLGGGIEDTSPMPVPLPVLSFGLDESHLTGPGVREGGWAGWTCVAGSWLVCKSHPGVPFVCPYAYTVVFATSGYANAFGVSYLAREISARSV